MTKEKREQLLLLVGKIADGQLICLEPNTVMDMLDEIQMLRARIAIAWPKCVHSNFVGYCAACDGEDVAK